jgi:hypothetical protein
LNLLKIQQFACSRHCLEILQIAQRVKVVRYSKRCLENEQPSPGPATQTRLCANKFRQLATSEQVTRIQYQASSIERPVSSNQKQGYRGNTAPLSALDTINAYLAG